jgi:type I restriction enzyme R subunit
MSLPNEASFEATTIERLKRLGYEYQHGATLRERDDFPLEEVLLRDALRDHLQAHYRELPDDAIEAAIRRAANPEGVTTAQRNMDFHRLLTRGFEVKYQKPSGEEDHAHVYLVDWQQPEANDFRVVNQLPIHGRNDRRPDLIVYVNGLPLVIFELKNPFDEEPTVEGAHNQLGHYTVDIPQLFDFNAFAVISDGANTLHGMAEAEMEWFAPWKTIDGRTVEPATTSAMKTLVEGLFPKARLLEYIRHFIVFEQVNEVVTKKGAKYHQFFGVRFAVEEALRATAPEGDRKIGVIWHTQGSGKSLSMIFFTGILRRRLDNPTFVIQVDRNDLDEQLFDNFVAARALVGEVKHAESVEELRQLLQSGGGEIIFTTIEKFRLREAEARHPVLSERRNIIVIADEAHRTQYGLRAGYAYHLRRALPNASFIGFTGTPVDFASRDTQAVFGGIIHTYDIPQAQEDGAIVPIYYEARLAKLQLINEQVDQELDEIAEGEEIAMSEKSKWAAIESAAGAQERMAEVARDLIAHFEQRSETLFGKGMIVCMSRRICVALYEEIVKLRPDWRDPAPDKGAVKVVMTGDITKDPKEWNAAGHITTKERREKLKARLKNPDDPLRLVIVRDMWLTGTDIPCLHTLYVDKPMRGHSLMQAIARVNRVFSNKPGGLVVDYIGVGHSLKEAARKYTADGFGAPADELNEAARERFFAELEAAAALLPEGVKIDLWRNLSGIELEDLCALVWGHLSLSDEKRDQFLLAEKRLSAAYSLVSHLQDCMARADEVSFCQMIRAGLKKTLPEEKAGTKKERERAVRDLIDRSISSEGIVDIFKAAGLKRPDISILDEQFLEEFKSKPQENLRLRLLEKLLADELKLHERRNLKKYRSFQEMLEEMLRRYHNNAITAAEVLQAMVNIRQEMRAEDRRKQETGLSDEELAFYDAIAGLGEGAYDMPFLCDLVRDVVQAAKRNLKVDWTKPHRENVKAGVQTAVKNTLRRKKIKADQFEFILRRVMEQAEALYADWPVAA